MKHCSFVRCILPTAILFLSPLAAQQSSRPMDASESAQNPEMVRLAKALVGDWNTTETMERGKFFPSGGSRRGIVHVRLASGGNALMYEVHSNGSAGELDGFLTIWWDRGSHLYYLFACFNDPNHPCRMRGTAHWVGEAFVNEYEATVEGRKTKWQDTFTFAPDSHTLAAAVDLGNGATK